MEDAAVFLAFVGACFLVLGAMGSFDEARRGPESPRQPDVETPLPTAPPCLSMPEDERRRHQHQAALRRLFNDVLATQAGRLGWGADRSGKRYQSVDEFLADEGHRRSVK